MERGSELFVRPWLKALQDPPRIPESSTLSCVWPAEPGTLCITPLLLSAAPTPPLCTLLPRLSNPSPAPETLARTPSLATNASVQPISALGVFQGPQAWVRGLSQAPSSQPVSPAQSLPHVWLIPTPTRLCSQWRART